jgi:hypothetical protein
MVVRIAHYNSGIPCGIINASPRPVCAGFGLDNVEVFAHFNVVAFWTIWFEILYASIRVFVNLIECRYGKHLVFGDYEYNLPYQTV